MSYAPAMTPCAAKETACWLLPHCRSTVVAGTLSGNPAASSRVARDVDSLVAHLGDGARDDVVNLHRIDSRPVDQFLQAVRQKVDGQHIVQRAAGLSFSDRGAYR